MCIGLGQSCRSLTVVQKEDVGGVCTIEHADALKTCTKRSNSARASLEVYESSSKPDRCLAAVQKEGEGGVVFEHA